MVSGFYRFSALLGILLLSFFSVAFASNGMDSDRKKMNFFVGLQGEYAFTGQLKGTVYGVDGSKVNTFNLKDTGWAGDVFMGVRNDMFRFMIQASPNTIENETLKVTSSATGNSTSQKIGFGQRRLLASFDYLHHFDNALYLNIGLVGGQQVYTFNLTGQYEASMVVFGGQAGINYDFKDFTVSANARYLTSANDNYYSVLVGVNNASIQPLYQNNLAVTIGIAYNF